MTEWASMAKVRFRENFPPGQFGRYLIVGAFNTAFGYGTYAGFTVLLTGHIPFAYILASLISGFLNITFSFLNYKWFIFKTRGGYLREWMRCNVVYGGTALLGTALLGPTVFAIRHLTSAVRVAPYVAGALLTAVTVVLGFLGHKNYSFATGHSSEIRKP